MIRVLWLIVGLLEGFDFLRYAGKSGYKKVRNDRSGQGFASGRLRFKIRLDPALAHQKNSGIITKAPTPTGALSRTSEDASEVTLAYGVDSDSG
jgi:hypothetical protein